MRFLTAYYASLPGADVVLDGTERMRLRPIGPLVDTLRSLGADITYVGEEGFPPLAIRGRALEGGEAEIDGSVSSQFVSAVMMVAPLMKNGLRLRFKGELASKPYVQMTLDMMADRGVEGDLTPDGLTIPNARYRQTVTPVEGDWTAAAAWYEIEALAAGTVNITNLSEDSVQGDRRLADFFARIGVDTDWEGEDGGIDLLANPDPDARVRIDFSGNPDLAMYAIVTCAMLGLPFRFSGMASLAVKECDRLASLRSELIKTGVRFDIPEPGVAEWDGTRRPVFSLPEFDSHDDHRMAMCLAPVSVFIPGIIVRNAEVVAKSYPGFWQDLASAGFTLRDPAESPETPQQTGED